MGRTTIGAPTLTKLKDLARARNVRVGPLASYFISENVSAASPSTEPTMATYSDIPLEYVLTISVSKLASTIVKDLYSLYGRDGCRVHAITSFLIEDALATYSYTPEHFPGVAHLPKAGVKSYRTATSVGLARSLYKRLQWQQELSVAECPEERPSIASLVEGILRTVPRQQLLEELGRPERVQEILETLSGEKSSSVRLSPGSFEFISLLASQTGAPKSKILTYVVAAELHAMEDTVVVAGGLLPDDIRERYAMLLGEIMAIGEKEDG